MMLERGGRRRYGRRCRCRRTAGKARGRVGSTVSVDAAASIGTRGESHGGSRSVGGRIRSPSVKCRTSTSSASRRDGGIQCAVYAHAGVGTTKAAAIANVLIRRVPLMINTCSSIKAARFVKLVEGTYALLPNEGRFAVAAAGIAACDDTGPIPTVQLGRTSVGPAAVDRPTTSGRTAGGGRRRPRRGRRSRGGVPFKIVGGHCYCVPVFCVLFVDMLFRACNVPTPDNPQRRRQSTRDVKGV